MNVEEINIQCVNLETKQPLENGNILKKIIAVLYTLSPKNESEHEASTNPMNPNGFPKHPNEYPRRGIHDLSEGMTCIG